MTAIRLIVALMGVNLLLSLGNGVYSYSLYSSLRESAKTIPATGNVITPDSSRYDFFAVDKIIFNLQDQGREHYFVLDLALQTDMERYQTQLTQLAPMLRNVVVAHLSQMTFTELRSLPITELQARLQAVLFDDFARKQLEIPFSAVLVSKLIVQ
jgi:flagellar FliL protein